MSILSAASGLPDIFTFSLTYFLDSFFIGNLWCSGCCNNVKFTLHAVYEDFQLQFSHSGNNGLTGFGITLNSEGWILIGKLAKASPIFS